MMRTLRHSWADKIHRFDEDQRGTTITEFVITLPIFIVIFVGILQLGTVTAHSVVVDARAYKNTWDAAIPISQQRFNAVHMVPAVAGAAAIGQVGPYQHTTTPLQEAFVTIEETLTYGAMALDGTIGESGVRVMTIDPLFDLFGLEGNVQTSLNANIIGDSGYAADLFDESIDFNVSGGGALAVLNSVISATGTRPAIAAGMRYGTVAGAESDTSNWLGLSVTYGAHFNTLVAPFPQGSAGDERLMTAIARLTMESHDPYAEVLGIRWSQPLSRDSVDVPPLHEDLYGPCGVSGCQPGP